VPKAIGYRKQALGYETKQHQAAWNTQQEILVNTESTNFARMGTQDSWAAAVNGYETQLKTQGLSGEARKIAVENFKSDLNAGRFDVLVKSGDTAGARAFAEENPADEATQKMRESQIDSAEKNAVMKLEQEARTRLTEGDARLSESAYTSTDPFWVPSLGEANALFQDPDVARAKVVEWTARAEEKKRKVSDAEYITNINLPEERSRRVSEALDVVRRMDLGNQTVEVAQQSLDGLDGIEGVTAEETRRLLSETISQSVKTEQGHMDILNLQIQARAVELWNDADAAVNNPGFFGFFGKGSALEGKVSQDDKGRIDSADESSLYFQAYMSGWPEFLQQRASEKGKSLTIPEVMSLEQEYFAPIKTWKAKIDFIGGSQAALKTLDTGFLESTSVLDELNTRGSALLDRMEQELNNANN
jgi:hypothetical protein